MQHYKNFKLASYVRGEFLAQAEMKEVEKGIRYFSKYLPLDKVYLDTHRETFDVPQEKMKQVKELFEKEGIQVSGAITSTIRMENDTKFRIFDAFCFTDQAYRQKYYDIVRYTASLFDEIILDDFFYTSCRCDDCLQAKGEKTWAEFRLDQMEEVSREIVSIAKSVNPNCKFIIKFPNWYESYQETGYNPKKERDIFDGIYTGTESRHSTYSQQHLQRYLSYSMIRLMENTAPGKNGGGWIDQGDSNANLNIWLEQAYLTLFAGARELTLFSFSELIGMPALPPLGQQLERIDRILSMTGNPVGIPVYEPFDADGEDQLMNYLGMTGLPLEPTPFFDENADVLLLTASAACDKDIVEKLKAFVRSGRSAAVTSGFLKAVQDKGIRDMTSVTCTGRKAAGRQYWADVFQSGPPACIEGVSPIFADVLQYKTNATWCELAFVSRDSNFPLLTHDFYGKGHLYVLDIPNDFADLYLLPGKVNGIIHRLFSKGLDVYLDVQAKCNLFLYDNDTFGIFSYHDYPTDMDVVLNREDVRGIQDLETGEIYCPAKNEKGERYIHVGMCNGCYRFFKLI